MPRNANRREQLEPYALLLVERAEHEAAQLVEPAAAPDRARDRAVRRLARAAEEPDRDGEDRRRRAERRPQPAAHELDDLLDRGRRLEQVDLVDHDHDLLAPLADLLE